MTLGQKLKALLKDNCMTQEDLAEKLEVSRHEPDIIRLSQEKPQNRGFALI